MGPGFEYSSTTDLKKKLEIKLRNIKSRIQMASRIQAGSVGWLNFFSVDASFFVCETVGGTLQRIQNM